ncbi:MAG: hypothetical protein QM791_19790 [Ferruginibacter sp.]
MMKAFLIVTSLVLLLPNFFRKDIIPFPAYNHLEDFDPSLSGIKSLDQLEEYVDKRAAANNITPGSFEYVELTESVVKQRFYHGFSHFSLNENWVAALGGRFDEGLACKVKPEDILQHSNAACSQQSIVMMALLRKKHIDYRKVGFPHHYAMEVMIGKNWFFFDPDMEPTISKDQRMETSWLLQGDSLKQYYNAAVHKDLDYQFGVGIKATTGTVNEIPAANIKIFHSLTAIASKLFWMLPLILLYFRPAVSFSPSFSLRIKRKQPKFSLAG